MSFWDSVRDFFSGGSRSDSGSSSSGGSSAPTRSIRPQPRPSIMTVQREGEDRQLVATRDIPRFGITEGQRESEPDYSPISLRALTSTEPANVMRNIQGAERQARAAPVGGGGEDRPAPSPAPAPAPVIAPALAPVQPTPVAEMTSVAEQETQIEKAGETAAAKARRLGLASTIATSPGGLLAGGAGTTRRRRSLMANYGGM